MKKYFVLFLVLHFSFSYGQVKNSEAIAYNWFNKVVGAENTGISNGIEYVEHHRTINEKHKFFKSFGFLPGSVVYDNQPYYNVELKYNVYDDLLIARITNSLGKTILQLHKEKIASFVIDGHEFINVPSNEGLEAGFYEILAKNEQLQLIKKHSKKQNAILDKEFVYYEFVPENVKYAFVRNGNYARIEEKEDMTQLFPGLEEEINDFYSTNNSLFNSNRELFMLNLFQEITSILSEENNIQ